MSLSFCRRGRFAPDGRSPASAALTLAPSSGLVTIAVGSCGDGL